LIKSQRTYLKNIYRYEKAGESAKDAILKVIKDNVKAVAKAQSAHNLFRVRRGLDIATAVILQTPALLVALPLMLPVMAAEYLTRPGDLPTGLRAAL
jgi:lipopolysaccharide/colanic/teichoic acid biosynthesis glycosyltransferase